jgi:hypothetical protein
MLVDVVVGLESHDDVHSAMTAAGVPDAESAAYLRALAGLASAGTIIERGLSEREVDTVREKQ